VVEHALDGLSLARMERRVSEEAVGELKDGVTPRRRLSTRAHRRSGSSPAHLEEGCGFYETGPGFVTILRRQGDDDADHADVARTTLYDELVGVIDDTTTD
jgi:hypothetical protein